MTGTPSLPTKQELAEAITVATRQTVLQLFHDHAERFYYVTLITTGEALPPFVAAWSAEALALESTRQCIDADLLKWSYADSPYCCYGESHFAEVNRLFGLRPRMTHEMTPDDWQSEHDFRLTAMETAMRRLDDEGLFGSGAARNGILVAVEVMPPDQCNVARTRRLNHKDSAALKSWLEEAAEK